MALAMTKGAVPRSVPRSLWTAAKWICALGIVLLLWRLSQTSLAELAELRIAWRPSFVLLVVASTFGYYLLNAYSWHRITLALGIAIPWRDAFSVWALTQLGKYVPGKVLMFAGRAAPYRLAGHAMGRIGGALVLEMLLRMAAAVVVFMLAWSTVVASYLEVGWVWVVAGLGAGVALALRSDILARLARLYGRWRGIPAPAMPATRELVISLAIEITAWLAAGASFYGLLSLFEPVPLVETFRISGAVALSGVGGFLSFFVPAGLGVREGIFVGLAKMIVPLPAAIGASVLARVWTTLFELALGGIGLTLIDGRRNEQVQRVYE